MAMESVSDSLITVGAQDRIFIYPPSVTQYTQFVATARQGTNERLIIYTNAIHKESRALLIKGYMEKFKRQIYFQAKHPVWMKKEITLAQEGDNRTEDS